MTKGRLAALVFLGALSGCAPAPRSTVYGPAAALLSGKNDSAGREDISPAAATGGASLAVPSREQLKKFNLDSLVLSYLETGSPDSLKAAVERIKADSRGMTDQNRVTLAVAGELMKLLYPLEPLTWAIPAVPDSDPYMGAIRSARQGVYDYNTGNADFLATVLPSLVLTFPGVGGDYFADAEASLKKSALTNPKSVLPPYFLGVLANRQGYLQAAADYYRQAWELDESCYPAGVGYARSLIDLGKADQALGIARRLQGRYAESVDMLRLCADAAFALRDWDSADPYILQVLKAEPENVAFLLMRARILVERKEYLKANSLLDAYATRDKTGKTYLLLRSRVMREWNKNPSAAASILQDALRLYPADLEVLLASAEVCYQTGGRINGQGGRELVSSVLSRDAANGTALSLLVEDYIRAAEWKSALETADRLQAVSTSESARILRVRALLGAGQAAKAVPVARELYDGSEASLSTTSAATKQIIIGLYLAALVDSGDKRAAADLIGRLLDGADSRLKSVLYFYQARLEASPEARLGALRSSLLADPRNQDALFAMYAWYFDRKDWRKAQYYLKQVIALEPLNPQYAALQAKLDELLAR